MLILSLFRLYLRALATWTTNRFARPKRKPNNHCRWIYILNPITTITNRPKICQLESISSDSKAATAAEGPRCRSTSDLIIKYKTIRDSQAIFIIRILWGLRWIDLALIIFVGLVLASKGKSLLREMHRWKSLWPALVTQRLEKRVLHEPTAK